jgi:predicted nucleic acid-binding protein
MAAKVLDSWTLMAFYHGEPAAEAVEEILFQGSRGKHQLLMSVINWAEIYTAFVRAESMAVAEARAREIGTLPIEIVGVGEDLALARQAAIYKARGGISYGDAYAAALAKERKAELVTGDAEFKRLEREIRIQWLRVG